MWTLRGAPKRARGDVICENGGAGQESATSAIVVKLQSGALLKQDKLQPQ